MQERLKKTYFRLLIPALIGFGLVFLDKELQITGTVQKAVGEVFIVAVFILSLVLAVAAPVFTRTLFAHQHKDSKRVAETEFIRFEAKLIRIALVTPYFSLIAYFFSFPEFYLVGSFLAGLYAIYYFYPSQRRISFERRIFRVK